MRIIFLEDVPGSGRAGEVKEVKNGYARNYLLPQKLASLATHDQLQRIETIRNVAQERRLKEETELGALAEQLSLFTVNLAAKMGPTGRFYGAVTATQIAEELSRLAGREIERREVHLENPIREPGEFHAEIRFAHGITTTVPVTVVAEGSETPKTAEQVEEAIETVGQSEATVGQPEGAEETEQGEESVSAEGQEEATETIGQLEQSEQPEDPEKAAEETKQEEREG